MKHVKFGKLDREIQIELFTAWLNGKSIQLHSPFHDTWMDTQNPCWCMYTVYRIKPEEFIFNWDSIDPKWLNLSRDGNTWNMCTGPIEFRLSYWVSVNASDDWVEMPTEIGNSVFNLGTLDHLKDSETLILRNP